jgi:molybdopterin synthase sulfur carrier subunit
MKITLRFFASVREALGTGLESLELPDGVRTVGAVRALLAQRGGAWEQALSGDRNLRMALNHVMCDAQTAVLEGGEVAFFPPVTGG